MFIRIKDVFEKSKFVLNLDGPSAAEAHINDFGLQALRKLPYKFAFPKKEKKLKLEKFKEGYKGTLPEDFHALYSAGNKSFIIKQGLTSTSEFSINGCDIYCSYPEIDLLYYSIPTDEDGNLLVEEQLEEAVSCYLVAKIAESKAFAPTTAAMYRAMLNKKMQEFTLLANHLQGVANTPNKSEMIEIREQNRSLPYEIKGQEMGRITQFPLI